MTKTILIFCVLLVSLFLVSAQDPVQASKALLGGGFYNTTITTQGNSVVVNLISVDENGAVLFQKSYDDAVNYYDGHKTSLITRPGFSFSFEYAFGCYRRCFSTSLIRENPPLLVTYSYPTCGGFCGV